MLHTNYLVVSGEKIRAIRRKYPGVRSGMWLAGLTVGHDDEAVMVYSPTPIGQWLRKKDEEELRTLDFYEEPPQSGAPRKDHVWFICGDTPRSPRSIPKWESVG